MGSDQHPDEATGFWSADPLYEVSWSNLSTLRFFFEYATDLPDFPKKARTRERNQGTVS